MRWGEGERFQLYLESSVDRVGQAWVASGVLARAARRTGVERAGWRAGCRRTWEGRRNQQFSRQSHPEGVALWGAGGVCAGGINVGHIII